MESATSLSSLRGCRFSRHASIGQRARSLRSRQQLEPLSGNDARDEQRLIGAAVERAAFDLAGWHWGSGRGQSSTSRAQRSQVTHKDPAIARRGLARERLMRRRGTSRKASGLPAVPRL